MVNAFRWNTHRDIANGTAGQVYVKRLPAAAFAMSAGWMVNIFHRIISRTGSVRRRSVVAQGNLPFEMDLGGHYWSSNPLPPALHYLAIQSRLILAFSFTLSAGGVDFGV
jgi:hypothetical protein